MVRRKERLGSWSSVKTSAVPAHLATEFAAVTLGTSLVFWLVLGTVFGKLNDVFAIRSAAVPTGAIA